MKDEAEKSIGEFREKMGGKASHAAGRADHGSLVLWVATERVKVAVGFCRRVANNQGRLLHF